MAISLFAFALAFVLAFANGANDVSKAIATLVGSGITDYRSAIAWGTVWTVVGAALAAFVASAMIKTFSHGLIQTGTIIEPDVTLAVLTGAIAWVLFASHTGLPVSTTHALTGAIVGTGFVAFAGEGLIWSAIGRKIALPLLVEDESYGGTVCKPDDIVPGSRLQFSRIAGLYNPRQQLSDNWNRPSQRPEQRALDDRA